MFDALTFYMTYWLFHKPLLLACLIFNRLSLVLYLASFIPVRPWMKPVNDNNGGSHE